MKVGLKIFVFIGVIAAVAAVAFWAGSANGHGGKPIDVGKMPEPAVRFPRAAAYPAAKPAHAALKRIVRSIGESGSAKPSAKTAVQSGKDVRSAFIAVLAELDDGRIGEDVAVRRLKALKKGDDAVLLACLREMSDSTDNAERLRALAVIEAAYGSDGTPPIIDLDADPDSREVAIEAHRTHELVEMVGSGLKDPDKTLRDAAFEVFNSLEGDPSFVLSRQILMGDDHELKMKLMDAKANTVTTQAIGLCLDALGNADDSVRAAAAKNLAAATGQSFASQDEARDWWEANCDEFMERVNGSVDMNTAAMAESSGPDESCPGQETNPNPNQAKEQKQ